jgi:hypothetical protein
MGVERATRLLVAATILAASGVVAARPGVRAGLGWVVPSFVQGTPSGDAIPHSTGAGQAVVRVEIVGGFVPPSFFVLEVPRFVLYGDGLVVYSGPQVLIEPPPALPNLRQLRVDEAGIQAVLAAAVAAGLAGEDRAFRNDLVMDASTTVFTVAIGDRVTTTSVYALGLELGPNAPAEQVAALEPINAFFAGLADLPAWLPAGSIVEPEGPFSIERLQVVSQPVADAGLQPTEAAEWPLRTPLAELGDAFSAVPVSGIGLVPFENARCGVVAGADAGALVAALSEAGAFTAWESDGELYAVYPRPLLPDEVGCPPRQDGVATPAP